MVSTGRRYSRIVTAAHVLLAGRAAYKKREVAGKVAARTAKKREVAGIVAGSHPQKKGSGHYSRIVTAVTEAS